jgi:hypothetical protein
MSFLDIFRRTGSDSRNDLGASTPFASQESAGTSALSSSLPEVPEKADNAEATARHSPQSWQLLPPPERTLSTPIARTVSDMASSLRSLRAPAQVTISQGLAHNVNPSPATSGLADNLLRITDEPAVAPISSSADLVLRRKAIPRSEHQVADRTHSRWPILNRVANADAAVTPTTSSPTESSFSPTMDSAPLVSTVSSISRQSDELSHETLSEPTAEYGEQGATSPASATSIGPNNGSFQSQSLPPPVPLGAPHGIGMQASTTQRTAASNAAPITGALGAPLRRLPDVAAPSKTGTLMRATPPATLRSFTAPVIERTPDALPTLTPTPSPGPVERAGDPAHESSNVATIPQITSTDYLTPTLSGSPIERIAESDPTTSVAPSMEPSASFAAPSSATIRRRSIVEVTQRSADEPLASSLPTLGRARSGLGAPLSELPASVLSGSTTMAGADLVLRQADHNGPDADQTDTPETWTPSPAANAGPVLHNPVSSPLVSAPINHLPVLRIIESLIDTNDTHVERTTDSDPLPLQMITNRAPDQEPHQEASEVINALSTATDVNAPLLGHRPIARTADDGDIAVGPSADQTAGPTVVPLQRSIGTDDGTHAGQNRPARSGGSQRPPQSGPGGASIVARTPEYATTFTSGRALAPNAASTTTSLPSSLAAMRTYEMPTPGGSVSVPLQRSEANDSPQTNGFPLLTLDQPTVRSNALQRNSSASSTSPFTQLSALQRIPQGMDAMTMAQLSSAPEAVQRQMTMDQITSSPLAQTLVDQAVNAASQTSVGQTAMAKQAEIREQFDESSPGGPPAPVGGSANTTTKETELDALAGKLYDRIRHRLRRELLNDRERVGLSLDGVR